MENDTPLLLAIASVSFTLSAGYLTWLGNKLVSNGIAIATLTERVDSVLRQCGTCTVWRGHSETK